MCVAPDIDAAVTPDAPCQVHAKDAKYVKALLDASARSVAMAIAGGTKLALLQSLLGHFARRVLTELVFAEPGSSLASPDAVSQDLPEGWEERQDPKTGKTYYVNHLTQMESWTDPRGGMGALATEGGGTGLPLEVLLLTARSGCGVLVSRTLGPPSCIATSRKHARPLPCCSVSTHRLHKPRRSLTPPPLLLLPARRLQADIALGRHSFSLGAQRGMKEGEAVELQRALFGCPSLRRAAMRCLGSARGRAALHRRISENLQKDGGRVLARASSGYRAWAFRTGAACAAALWLRVTLALWLQWRCSELEQLSPLAAPSRSVDAQSERFLCTCTCADCRPGDGWCVRASRPPCRRVRRCCTSSIARTSCARRSKRRRIPTGRRRCSNGWTSPTSRLCWCVLSANHRSAPCRTRR